MLPMQPVRTSRTRIGNGLKPVLLLMVLCVSASAAEPAGILLTHTGTEKRDLVCPDAESLVYCEQINPYQLGLMKLSLKDGTITRLHPDFRTNEFEPAFSADGKTIAFTGNRDGNYKIYMLPMTGGTPTRVTTNPERDDYPAWTPAGAIVYVEELKGRFDIRRESTTQSPSQLRKCVRGKRIPKEEVGTLIFSNKH